VRSARHRKPSSTQWLSRQLNDPYVAEARRRGYRSRAAFKLIELDDRFRLLLPGRRIVDLGCAPGGWTQVAVERVGARAGRGAVVGIDLELLLNHFGGFIHFEAVIDQHVAQITREMGLLEIGFVVRAGREHDHASFVRLPRRELHERVLHLAKKSREAMNVIVAKRFRQNARGDKPIRQRVARAGRNLRAIGDHPPAAIRRT